MRISDWSSDVCSSDLPGQRVALPETVANHLLRVLRLGVGDALIVFNGDGFDYHATLTNAERRAAQITVQSRVTVNRESALSITPAQGIARGDQIDWVLQKAEHGRASCGDRVCQEV